MTLKVEWDSIRREIAKKFANVPSISTEALSQWLQDGSRRPPILFDTRGIDEFSVSHLPSAIHAETAKNVLAHLSNLSNTSDESGNPPVVVYCSVGYRSAKVAKVLLKKGFNTVYNLDGSIFQWSNENRPVFQGDVQVTDVHPYDKKWGQLLN